MVLVSMSVAQELYSQDPLVPEKNGTLLEVFAPIQQHLEHVKAAFQAIVPPQSQWLAESLSYSLSTSGKFVRPALGLFIARALNNDNGVHTAHTKTMAVAEMIHVATLLHDDVLDDADLRRGQPTVRQQWGNTVSILSGDYLLAQASRTLSRLGFIRLVGIYSDVLADLCDGEVEQLRTQYLPEASSNRLSETLNPTLIQVNWESYYQKTMCKTASLFGAVTESSAYLCQRPESDIQACRQFGLSLGIAFQMADDLLDYTSTADKAGKPVMGDLKQGLLTAPILLALESAQATPKQQEELRRLMHELIQLNQVEWVDAAASATVERALMTVLTDLDVFEQTERLAQEHVEKAFAALHRVSELDDSAVVALQQLSNLMVKRSQ